MDKGQAKTKDELIELIPWEKQWDELSLDDKANFLNLNDLEYLNDDNRNYVTHRYQYLQYLVEERGKQSLLVYIGP